MTPNDDGKDTGLSGGSEQPTSTPSDTSPQQLSPDVSALVKEVTELRKELRGLQKGSDKRFERQDENIKRILELKEQGLTQPQIERELWIDQQMKGQDTPPQAPGGTEGARQAPNVESAFRKLEEYNLQQNDSDFLAILRKSQNMTPEQFDKEVDGFVLRKVKPSKPANPADVVQPPARGGGQTTLSDEERERLSGEKIDLMREPSKNAARIAEINAKLKG